MIEIHRVTPDRLADLEELFETRGTLRGCRCMIFRAGVNGKVPPPSGSARKRAMAVLVRSGTPVGLLGYSEGTPVAWCSVAPRTTFPGLVVVGAHDDPIWSLTCFYIKPEYRGRGLQRKLLDAAIREARTQGARALEAYPVEPDSPSYRFGGFTPFFTRAGFREVGRLGSRRHVMRKPIGPTRGRI
jgi:ribosomal protein S18 acetylase RimI-like enzyme